MAVVSTDQTKGLTAVPLDDDTFELVMDCVHCGFCLPTCPTFALTGDETDSPRGRLYYIRLLAEGRVSASPRVLMHLDRCLDCRACETACPSGVQYGFLIERVRTLLARRGLGPDRQSRYLQFLIRYIFPYANRLELTVLPVRLVQRLGLSSFIGRLPLVGSLVAMVPPLPPLRLRSLPERFPARGNRRGRVGLLTGCVASVFYSSVNWATAQVLSAIGYEVIIPKRQGCCGSLLAHNGYERDAQSFARDLITVFEKVGPLDAVIVTAAGCGATMKRYDHFLADDPSLFRLAQSFAKKVCDLSEFLDRINDPIPFKPIPLKVSYHDPCHLAHGQQVREAPRRVLQRIPQLQYVELEEADWCCGSAGVYNILQKDMAEAILKRKIDNINRTGADIVVTANPGCLLQLKYGFQKYGVRARLLHLAEIVKEALDTTQ